ncbi:hypothetical protein Tco_0360398 [Tanacetum coccineum]
MLVENKYPLKKEVLSQMLKIKLECEEDSTIALELIKFVKKQIAESKVNNSDGDEKFSIYLVAYNEKLAILEQTATSKGKSNPLIAGDLLKIMWLSMYHGVNTPGSDENSMKLYELMYILSMLLKRVAVLL